MYVQPGSTPAKPSKKLVVPRLVPARSAAVTSISAAFSKANRPATNPHNSRQLLIADFLVTANFPVGQEKSLPRIWRTQDSTIGVWKPCYRGHRHKLSLTWSKTLIKHDESVPDSGQGLSYTSVWCWHFANVWPIWWIVRGSRNLKFPV